MANCCLSGLRGIWSCLMGSLRMIMFFMCLLYTIGAAIYVLLLIKQGDVPELNDLPGVAGGPRLSDYLHAFGLFFLGVLGVYGAFYNHKKSIRSFSLLSALNVLLLTLLLLYTMGPDQLRKENDKAFEKFRDLMPNYSWDRHDLNKATRSWDALQKTACCGVEGPQDWAPFRPDKSEYKDAYPASCCFQSDADGAPHAPVCRKTDYLFVTGCSQRVLQIQALSMVLSWLFVMYQLALSVFSYMVGNCTADPRPERPVAGIIYPRSQAIYVDRQYQQPPVNRDYVDQPHAKPPMYPNLHDSSNFNYSAPPPSYGT